MLHECFAILTLGIIVLVCRNTRYNRWLSLGARIYVNCTNYPTRFARINSRVNVERELAVILRESVVRYNCIMLK